MLDSFKHFSHLLHFSDFPCIYSTVFLPFYSCCSCPGILSDLDESKEEFHSLKLIWKVCLSFIEPFLLLYDQLLGSLRPFGVAFSEGFETLVNEFCFLVSEKQVASLSFSYRGFVRCLCLFAWILRASNWNYDGIRRIFTIFFPTRRTKSEKIFYRATLKRSSHYINNFRVSTSYRTCTCVEKMLLRRKKIFHIIHLPDQFPEK